MGQLGLLRSRRFVGLFWAQFLGAFNDNLFKNALVILVAYQGISLMGIGSEQLVALSGGILILPFVLFSATAGELADRFRKSSLVRWIKLAEIAIMSIAAAGFVSGRFGLLFVVLFLLGCQSSFFGPVKYSILPQLLHEDELVGGNALSETGTFLAILLGTIAGGLVIAQGQAGRSAIAVTGIAIALAGYASSYLVPGTVAENPTLRISANPLGPLRETWTITRRIHSVYLSVLGVSWFWFFGAAILALLPVYTKDTLRADEHVITFFLALFCAGIALGSLLCERLSDRKLELGLVPLGSIGMTIFAFDLFLAGVPSTGPLAAGQLVALGDFLAAPRSWRIVADLTLLAVFSGFFIVPLNTFIQQRSAPSERSRVVAGGNILSALFMVAASGLLVAFFAAGLTVLQIFAVVAVMNAAVAAYIYKLLPEFLFRFVCWIVANCMYRLRTVGRDNIPQDGPVLLVCNHVSFVDWMIVSSACKRPARFVMYHGFLKVPLLGWVFRDAKVIPISPAREDEHVMEAAFDRIAAELEAGEVVCIFPEGALTKDGRLGRFRPGVEKIVRRTPVPVVPMALIGMWGSFFSRKDGAPMHHPFRRVWSRIQLAIGPPLTPEQVTAERLAERVAALGGFEPPQAPGHAQVVPAGGTAAPD